MIHTFNSSNGEIITLRMLTPEYCKEILEIINIIPHMSWSTEELFFENDYFGNKWNYSLAAVNSANEVVGVQELNLYWLNRKLRLVDLY